VRSLNFLLTHANDSHGGSFFLPPFVCICLVLSAKTVRITKPDIEMFHDESWKRIYCPVKVTSHNHCQCGFLHSCECWLLLDNAVPGIRYNIKATVSDTIKISTITGF